MLSEIFWGLVLSTVSLLILACLSGIYASKCRTIKCCGAEIERDIEAEVKEDEMNHNNQPKK